MNYADKINELKSIYGHALLGIYLRGSHLQNLVTANSDIDFHVVVKTDIQVLMENRKFNQDVHSDDWEYKVSDEYSFIAQVIKGSRTVIELFIEKPIFVSEEWGPMNDFLFNNFFDLIQINPRTTLNSFAGVILSDLKVMDKLFVDSSNTKKIPGKHLASLLRMVNQGQKTLSFYELDTPFTRKELIESIKLNGEFRDKLIELKNITSADEARVEYNRTIDYINTEADKFRETAKNEKFKKSNRKLDRILMNLMLSPELLEYEIK